MTLSRWSLLPVVVVSLVGCGRVTGGREDLASPLAATTDIDPNTCLPNLVAESVYVVPPKKLTEDGAAFLTCRGVPVNTDVHRHVRIRNIGCGEARGPIPWALGTNSGGYHPPGTADGCANVATLAPGNACDITWTDSSPMPWRLEYFLRVDPYDVIEESKTGFSQIWFYTEFEGPYIHQLLVPSATPGTYVGIQGLFQEEVNTVVVNGVRVATSKKTHEAWDYLAFVVPELPVGQASLRVESECGTSLTYPFQIASVMCGGIQGLGCPDGMTCEFGPNCDPWHGGADCSGICVPMIPK